MTLKEYKSKLKAELTMAESALSSKLDRLRPSKVVVNQLQTVNHVFDSLLSEKMEMAIEMSSSITSQLLPENHKVNTILNRIILFKNLIKKI